MLLVVNIPAIMSLSFMLMVFIVDVLRKVSISIKSAAMVDSIR